MWRIGWWNHCDGLLPQSLSRGRGWPWWPGKARRGRKNPIKSRQIGAEKGHTSEGLESKEKMPAPTHASHVSWSVSNFNCNEWPHLLIHNQFHKNMTLSTKRGFLSLLCWKISTSMTFPRGCTMYNTVLLLVVKKSNNKEIATRPPRFPWLIVLFYCTSSNCSVSSFSRPIINSCSTSSSLGYYCQLTPFSFIAPNTQTSLLLQWS